MIEQVQSLEAMQNFAHKFISNLESDKEKATIVGLYGDLGAGKTTFTQSVAKALGVVENIVSPTFVIMKFYELSGQKWKKLIHIDAYRLEKSSELTNLGWQEIINNQENLVLIEWPEKVEDIMPVHTQIHFTHVSDNTRSISVIPALSRNPSRILDSVSSTE